jgi:hypothetical protein
MFSLDPEDGTNVHGPETVVKNQRKATLGNNPKL